MNSCSLDALKNRFPSIGDIDSPILLNKENLEEIKNWINVANNQAKEQGFEQPLYSIREQQIGIIKNNKVFKSSDNVNTYLNINKENLEKYQNHINNTIIPDIQFSEKINPSNSKYTEDQLLNTIYYSPNIVPGSDVDTPVNFAEWLDSRKFLLSELESTRSKMLARKATKEELKQINISIANLREEIVNTDTEDISNVHHNLVEEVNALYELVQLASDTENNPVLAANIIENNKIKDRIDDLTFMLNNFEESGVVANFNKGLDEASIYEIQGRIAEINQLYEKSLSDIIKNIMLNNDFMLQLKSNISSSTNAAKKEELQQLENLITELLDTKNTNKNPDGDNFLGQNFLGARSYDSILTEVIAIVRDNNQTKEAGLTLQNKKTLQTAYENLVTKSKKVGKNVEYFIDKLFAKDEFGQNTSYLVSPFSADFYGKQHIINNGQEAYLNTLKGTEEQDLAYGQWMDILDANVDFIEPYRLQSFKELYGEHEDFKEFFKYSEAEMQEYENELKNKLGPTAYQIEIAKQEKAIQNFLIDGHITDSDKYHQNPMRFMENYYSDNYKEYDSSTGEYYLPTYTSNIPKLTKSDYFNEDFSKIEKEGGKDFVDFYSSASKLLEYNKDVFDSIGMDHNLHDIINIQDSAGRAAMSDLSFFGKIWKNLGVIYRNLGSEFYAGGHEKDSSAKGRELIKTHYFNYGKNEYNKMKEIYSEKPVEYLINEVEKSGLTLPRKYKRIFENLGKVKELPADATDEQKNKEESKRLSKLKRETSYLQNKLSDVLARNNINKSSSLDIFKRIMYATSIAESIATRNNTISTINLIKDYSRNNDLKNVSKYIDVWEANNIIQPGSLTSTMVGRLEAKPISAFGVEIFGKKYTEVEKSLKDLYKKEKDNLSDKNTFDFKTDKYLYTTDETNPDGKYVRTEREVNPETGEKEKVSISLDQMQTAYEGYLQTEIDNLGSSMSYGKLLGGLMWNMFRTYLHINPKSGYNNRLQGKMQNNQAAAAGIYDFNVDQLNNARWLLNGTGTKKLVDYLPGKKLGLNNLKRVQQWGILMHLAENLGLLSNVMEDISGGDGSISTGSQLTDKVKEFLGDFAMNIPEFHNQMELLVAMMQNDKYSIEDIDGNKTPLFNPKTMSFPFDPKTMKLLPQYRTVNNIANWEKFDKDEEGNAPQSVLLQSYQMTRDKLHGNYRNNDKIALQSTMTGRGLSAFMKWSYENLNNQYGIKKASLTTASVDVKGRKVVLAERFPVLITHMALNNVGLVTAGTGLWSIASGLGTLGAITAGSIISFPVIGSIIGTAALAYHIKRNKFDIKMSKDDLALTMNYAKEVALRTIKTTANGLTRGATRNLLYTEDTLKNWTGSSETTYRDRNSTFKERQIMSESAQELADKFSLWSQFALAGIAMKAFYVMLAGLNGDDDDKEAMLSYMEDFEGRYKYLMNMRNNLLNDTQKWTSPTALFDSYSQVILAKFISDSYAKITETQERIDDGRISETSGRFKQASGLFGPAMGLPNQVLDALNPETKYLTADRVYDNTQRTILDEQLAKGHLEGEAKFKPLVEGKRRKIRKELEGVFRKKLRDAGIENDFEMKKLIKKNIDKTIKKNKLNIKKGVRNNEDIYNNTDWDNVVDKVKESDNLITK